MPELQQHLDTIQPELTAMTRLFSLPDTVWDHPCSSVSSVSENTAVFRTESAAFTLTAAETDTEYRITFAGFGRSVTRSAPVPADPADARTAALHRRRAVRRLCKQTLYFLLKAITGFQPPWGSMTGVRPTHLMLEALGNGLSPEEAVETLIRDFDVSRSKAELLAEVAAEQQKLPPPDDQFADVYIGIPFCTTRCAYCSFSSGEIGKGVLVPPYMDALEKEMCAVSRLLTDSGKTLRAVYIGGGTPTALNLRELERLLAMTEQFFPHALETTVEAGRPDTLDREKFAALRRSKIRRISINPQTMNDRTLQIIGRAHTAQQVRNAYSLAREAGIPHINMDVIAGLPGETEADFAHTMEEALTLRPESLTVHTLTLKRSSRMSLEKAPLPDGAMTARMVSRGADTARQMGMHPYYLYRQKFMAGNQENTGYALPGHACLYNVDMMEETTHILAVGAGGISKRIWPEEGRITRAPNVSNIEEYIRRVDEMIRRKQDLFPGN